MANELKVAKVSESSHTFTRQSWGHRVYFAVVGCGLNENNSPLWQRKKDAEMFVAWVKEHLGGKFDDYKSARKQWTKWLIENDFKYWDSMPNCCGE